ncbi:GNAT family N-acetyltransferase [Hyphomicrobium sp. 1Nfss2.1]|uniref:GNAT family N-acetyltransferase n=1 Tax=Hyphomicrobium sp. 1Nfss2.1 TaxID=3413936 RepID=UPI003C7D17DC
MLSERSHCDIRPGQPADAAAVSEVFRTSWHNAYQGIIPHLQLDSMIRRRTSDWWAKTLRSDGDNLVLEVSGDVVGYATLGPSRTRGRFEGEIYELYMAPPHQGLGFGECLFEACRYRLDERRLRGLLVWALADNASASDFYWGRGGRPVATAYERFGPSRLQKVAFGWD